MAPKGKKGKKKPALGDWGSDGDEDAPGLDPVAAAAKGGPAADEAAASDAAAPARQASGKQKGKKGKKGKGKKALGDWSDEDEAPQPAAPTTAAGALDSDEEPQPAARMGSSGGGGGFAALPDEDDDTASEQNGAAGSASDSDSIEPVGCGGPPAAPLTHATNCRSLHNRFCASRSVRFYKAHASIYLSCAQTNAAAFVCIAWQARVCWRYSTACRSCVELQVEPIVAKVIKVARHPKSDKLKVCQMDTGEGTVQVVTNAASVAAGMAVILAVRCASLETLLGSSTSGFHFCNS